MPNWLSLQDIAEELQIPLRTVQYYSVTDASFPSVYRFGKRHSRVASKDFESWKETKIQQPY